MLSTDTPESTVGGSPPNAQATLDRCRQRLVDGVYDDIDEGLRAHLLARLTPDAAQRHLTAGGRANEEFARMRDARLLVNPDTGVAKVGSSSAARRSTTTAGCWRMSPRGRNHRCHRAMIRGGVPSTCS